MLVKKRCEQWTKQPELKGPPKSHFTALFFNSVGMRKTDFKTGSFLQRCTLYFNEIVTVSG